MGTGADVATNGLDNTTAIGYNATVSASNTMAFGNGAVNNWVFGIPAVTAAGHALEVGSGAGNGNGAYLTNGGVWTNASDRNKKENFTNLNGNDILKKIASLPITQWRYIGTNEYHIGPMAQDFMQAFNVGYDDKSISTIDASGVALTAIKGLNEIVQEKDAKINRLEKELNAIKRKLGM